MQLKHFFIAGFLTAATFVSCKKSNNVKPVVPVEGIWVGKSSVLSEPYNNYYSFSIKPGGALERLDAAKQKVATGTWKLEGIIFTATYTFLPPATGTFSVIASFNNEKATLDGTWGTGTQEYGGGYWYMNKTN